MAEKLTKKQKQAAARIYCGSLIYYKDFNDGEVMNWVDHGDLEEIQKIINHKAIRLLKEDSLRISSMDVIDYVREHY